LLAQFADGVALGWSLGLAVLWFDFGSIGSAMARLDSATLTTAFFVQTGLLFGTLVMCVAVMNLSDDQS